MNELMDILGGKPGAAPKATKAAAPSNTYDPVDAAVRTVMSEESDPTAQDWVAGVIANRAKKSGKNFYEVVTEKNQFEPWSRGTAQAVDPNSEAYKKTAERVRDILDGKRDPSEGATHFYAPDAQAALAKQDGRSPKAEFDDGTGVRVGKTLFFRKGDAASGGSELASVLGGALPEAVASADADFAKAFGDPAKYEEKVDFTAGSIPFRDLKDGGKVEGVLSKPQEELYAALNKGGGYKPDDPEGSPYNMLFMQEGVSEKDIPPGAYYVTRSGEFKRAAGGDQKDGSAVKGFGQGAADVALSVANFMPGSDDSTIKNRLKTDQMVYDADHKGELGAGLGRFIGQAVTAAPVIGAGEAAVGAGLAKAGVTKLLGAAPGLAAKGAALVGRGAAEGAAGAGLVSSTSDAPLSEQLATGAIAGGVLGPILPGVQRVGQWAGKTARDLVQPLSHGGREEIVNRIVGNFADGAPMASNAAEIVPGSVPTLAQATGNPGVASLERTVRLGRPTPFAERDTANAEARASFLENTRGDEQTVADLVQARRGVVDDARERAFAQTTPADTQQVVTALDAALEAPAAHMEAVSRPLQAIRDKIVQPPADTTPEQTRAFNRAVAQTFGATDLTPESMSAARRALGGRFEEIAANTTVPWDDALRNSVGQIIQDTAQVVPESSLPPLFRQLDNIASTANNGADISGASYQALTKKGAPLSSLQSSADPTIREAANRIREALDDGLERSLGAAEGSESSLSALREARLAYKNLKTAEAALKSAGPDRQVTPQSVMSAVKRNFGQFAYQGGGPLGDAAEAALREQSTRPPRIETDPQQLFGMRESLSSAISKLEKDGTDASQLAADHLRGVRTALDSTIEGGAPGYRQYVDVAERSAEPIEATKFLQGLRLTDMRGNVTLAKVDNALTKIAAMRAKPGENAAKGISEASIRQLEALKEDLLRADQLNRGRPIGSDTAQHLVTSNIAGNMSTPVALGASALAGHPAVGAALGAGKMFYKGKNEQVLDQLTARLLNPEAPLKNVTPKKTGPVRKGLRILGNAVLPVGGAVATSAVNSQ